MIADWTFSEQDQAFADSVQDYLPGEVFDVHAHLYRVGEADAGGFVASGPAAATIDVWREHMSRQVGTGRPRGALFIPMPRPGRLTEDNDYVVEQVANAPDSRGSVLISPGMDREDLDRWLAADGIAGLKPYHVFSTEDPTFQASLGSYLPVWAWALAHERSLVITLHLVRDRALADPGNLQEIVSKCREYPQARLILAHAARGFHAPNTIDAVASLRGLENVYFDSAAVCESAAMEAILYEFGPRKLLWGSDFPVSEKRGTCVTVGDGFAWINPDRVDVHPNSPACNTLPVGLESLRALKQAADNFGLNDQDLRDIFHDNACRLFGLRGCETPDVQELYTHAKTRIPGGTQLLSKRPEMFAPDQWPAYFREARGCETWDTDGRHYYDMSGNGIGSCLLGFRDPDVTRAVRRRINLGSMCTLNPPEEVELADLLCELHTWADCARFTRAGGEVGSVAARIARATTDRSVIAICGYHGWHDWYLAANLGEDDALTGHLLPGLHAHGVPRELRGTTLTFQYGDRAGFDDVVRQHGDRLAAVFMEPCRHQEPDAGFLRHVRDGAHRAGALLVFDEITIGWRIRLGGVHLEIGVDPDMAIFAKALGNGNPIGAVIGTRAAMEGAHKAFISSTYWTEGIGPTAALATVRKMRECNLQKHLAHVGTRTKRIWREAAARHGLPLHVEGSFPCLASLAFEHDLASELRTLFTQFMLDRGFLAGSYLYATLAHTDDILDQYGEATDEVFAVIARTLEEGRVKEALRGPVAHSGFRRLVR